MLKFHCKSCDKKIGAPEKYAGKRVKCPRCGEAVRVPKTEAPAPQPAEDEPGAYDLDFGAMSALEDGAPVEMATGSPDYTGARCPQCNQPVNDTAVICIGCGHHFKKGRNVKEIRAQKQARRQKTAATTKAVTDAAGKQMGGLVGALVGGGVGAVVGAGIWAGIAIVTNYELAFVALLVGFLAGTGTTVCTDERSPLIGLVSAAMAIGGVVAGKYLIVMYLLPDGTDEEIKLVLSSAWDGMDFLFVAVAAANAFGFCAGLGGDDDDE